MTQFLNTDKTTLDEMHLTLLHTSDDGTVLVEHPTTGWVQVQTDPSIAVSHRMPIWLHKSNKGWVDLLKKGGVDPSTIATLTQEQLYEWVVSLDGTQLEDIPTCAWTPRLVRRAFDQNYRVVDLLSSDELEMVLTPKDIEGLLLRSGEYLFSLDHSALSDPSEEWIHLALSNSPEVIRYFDPDDITLEMATIAVQKDPLLLNVVPFTIISNRMFWDTVFEAAKKRPETGAFVRTEWPAELIERLVVASPQTYLFFPKEVRNITTPVGRKWFELVRGRLPIPQIMHVLQTDQSTKIDG